MLNTLNKEELYRYNYFYIDLCELLKNKSVRQQFFKVVLLPKNKKLIRKGKKTVISM